MGWVTYINSDILPVLELIIYYLLIELMNLLFICSEKDDGFLFSYI